MSGSRVLVIAAAALVSGVTALTQGEIVDPASKTLPNPNSKVIKNFGALPDGRVWGNTAGVDIGPDGQVWAYDRCGSNSCAGSNVDPILKFDRNSGKLLASFGRGQFIFPHGIHVDREGNVWITDGRAAGKVLLRLGKPGVGQRGTDTFNEPNDVITAPNGDIFVSDGHSGQNPTATPDTNARIVKFTKDGKFVAEWRQFSRVSGLFIARNDMLYASDSESSPERHPNWKTGVRIGTTKEDKVLQFIPPHALPNGAAQGAAGEGVAVDPDGNVYGAEGPISRQA